MKKVIKYFVSFAFLGFFLLSAAGSGDSLSSDPDKPLYDDAIAIKVTAESLIKKTLRDPDSYQLIEITPETGKLVTVRYRAKNGFGGYNVCEAVVSCDEKKMTLISNSQ